MEDGLAGRLRKPSLFNRPLPGALLGRFHGRSVALLECLLFCTISQDGEPLRGGLVFAATLQFFPPGGSALALPLRHVPALACHAGWLLYLFEILVILIVTVPAVSGSSVELAGLIIPGAHLVAAWRYFGKDLLD